jgi:flavin reductase (DIM6/NTAB) family NADH-FMN oxidoreductase RutF
MQIDPRDLRACMGHFTTGVTVVSSEVGGEPHGATVNAFTSVSLDPPLVLVSLARTTRSSVYLAGRPFTVNVLREGQHDVALHFAGNPIAPPPRWEPLGGGLAPRLASALAYIACTPWRAYDGGDHILYVGEVQRIEHFGGAPLVFFRGAFRELGPSIEEAPWLESLDSPSSLRFSMPTWTP